MAGEASRSANLVHQAIHTLTFTKDMIHTVKVGSFCMIILTLAKGIDIHVEAHNYF